MRALVNRTELFYTIEGQGCPMLLMHGMGFDHTLFRPWLDPLGDRLQLVYFDSRGSGRSSRLEGFERVTIETLVEDADALRTQLGFDRVVLYGHSFGGYPALEYARRHADHLAGLIQDCTAPAFDYQPVMHANARARGTAEQVQQIVDGFSGQMLDDEAMCRTWKSILPLYFHRYDPALGGKMVNQMRFSAAAFNHFGRFIPSMNMVDRLDEITTPTLVLVEGMIGCARRSRVLSGCTLGCRIPASSSLRRAVTFPSSKNSLNMFEQLENG